MDVVTEPKRPWTIKWAVGILVFLNILGDIYTIFNSLWKPSSLIGNIVVFAILFAIWQGKRWVRNLLFIYLLFILPLLVAGSGLFVINTETYDKSAMFGLFILIMFLISVYMMFMKSSNEWFASMNGEQFQEQSQPSWNFQLTLIGISMGLGFLVLGVNSKVSFIPLAKEIMVHYSTYSTRFAVLLTFESLDFLIGVMVALFPFALIIGYWKKENLFFMTRLITMGAILPVLAFPVGKTLFLFSTFFFSKVLILGVVTYFGLRFGMWAARYFDTLRVPIEIK
jgi:hypothetical protein